MGWTSFHMGDHFNERRYIKSLFEWSYDSPFTTEIVKMSKVGSTWYVAYKKTPKPNPYDYIPDPDGSITFAEVILTSKRNGEFIYKNIGECSGPMESKAPLSLLNLLSPTTSEYANEWRDRCRAWARRPKPKIGDVVKLHTPWEPYGDLFEKIKWPRSRSVYRSLKTGDAVRLRGSDIKEIVHD